MLRRWQDMHHTGGDNVDAATEISRLFIAGYDSKLAVTAHNSTVTTKQRPNFPGDDSDDYDPGPRAEQPSLSVELGNTQALC